MTFLGDSVKHLEVPLPTVRAECKDGFSISIQANNTMYCTPRVNKGWPYDEVELGFPSEEDDLIIDFAENFDDPCNTVYPYVPIEIVNQLIEKHSGIIN